MFNANFPWMKDLQPFKEPWWYNAATDELLPPLGAHHAGVFMRQPEILGLTADDLTSKYNGEDARLAATTTALSQGWSRIDIVPNVGAYIFAPTIKAANLSIAAIDRITPIAPSALSITIFAEARKFVRPGEVLLISLRGTEAHRALSQGIPSHHIPHERRAESVGASKMVASPRMGRCPFGRGVR